MVEDALLQEIGQALVEDGDDDEEDSLLKTQFPSTDDAISTFTTKGLKVISINAIKSVGGGTYRNEQNIYRHRERDKNRPGFNYCELSLRNKN